MAINCFRVEAFDGGLDSETPDSKSEKMWRPVQVLGSARTGRSAFGIADVLVEDPMDVMEWIVVLSSGNGCLEAGSFNTLRPTTSMTSDWDVGWKPNSRHSLGFLAWK